MQAKQLSNTEIIEAKQHLLIALDEFKPLPATHEELVEKMRDYFEDQRIEVFSKFVASRGDGEFRDFIADTVVESGKYFRDEKGQVRVVA